MDIDRAVFLEGDYFLADFLTKGNNNQKVRFEGTDFFHHVWGIDIFSFDAGKIVFLTPHIDIGMVGCASVSPGRTCRLCKHPDQFVVTVKKGPQTRNAELS